LSVILAERFQALTQATWWPGGWKWTRRSRKRRTKSANATGNSRREHADDPDWQYLGIRAMPEGPEQDQAFREAFEKWPDNVWLANAVAYDYALHADWEKPSPPMSFRSKGPVPGSTPPRSRSRESAGCWPRMKRQI
jgi:hypothetical protein